jgi:uncharacterized MAPEG superfamily protein
MKPEYYWLALIILQTALMFVPYAMNLFYKQGLIGALHYYDPKNPPLSDWAQKAKAAHMNAVENLVLIAPATLLFLLMTRDAGSDETVILCLKVYFFARIAHYVVYAMRLNYVRTLFFFAGFIPTLIIIFKVIQLATAL